MSMPTNQQILEKAIQKAIDGGWDMDFGSDRYRFDVSYNVHPTDKDHYQWTAEEVIFNHDFAKALWGDKVPDNPLVIRGRTYGKTLPAWQYHLQQMVIGCDPIKYLGENL